jgi:hypothetical protein
MTKQFNPKARPTAKNLLLRSWSYCYYGMARITLHSMFLWIHNNVYTFRHLYLQFIYYPTDHITSYLILDKIFTTIEKEIVGLLGSIFWPFRIKCAMQRNWLQTNKTHIGYVGARKTLASKRQAYKKSISVETLTSETKASSKSIKQTVIIRHD